MRQGEFAKGVILSLMQIGKTGDDLLDHATRQIAEGIMSGECEHKSAEVKSDEKLARSYARALAKDRLKKDTDLNGGVKYEPITKRGPIVKDPELKKLKEVLKALEWHKAETNVIDAVKAKIAEKEAEIAASKSNVPSMDEALEVLKELGIA